MVLQAMVVNASVVINCQNTYRAMFMKGYHHFRAKTVSSLLCGCWLKCASVFLNFDTLWAGNVGLCIGVSGVTCCPEAVWVTMVIASQCLAGEVGRLGTRGSDCITWLGLPVFCPEWAEPDMLNANVLLLLVLFQHSFNLPMLENGMICGE